MAYKWKYPPIKFIGLEDSQGGSAVCNQDDLNQAEVMLRASDIPEESRRMYDDEFFTDGVLALEDGDQPDVEIVQGFFIAADADLSDPSPAEVFVYSTGPEREAPGVYLPIGQHADGSYHPGDYLISIEDYLAISAGIYTPEVYVCSMVREWDPYKQIASWR